MRIDILTLFPEMFPPILSASILGRAAESGVVNFRVHDIRAFADNKHRKVDDRPFGGGPGMVMMCQPLHDAVLSVEGEDPRPARRILLTPQGERLTQRRVEQFAREPRLLLIAGHYEGIDERVIEELAPLEISVGDYVLSGGELPAMVLADAVVRLQPNALGHEESALQDSFAMTKLRPEFRVDSPADRHPDRSDETSGSEGRSGIGAGSKPAPVAARVNVDQDSHLRLLDCPHYTRPREWRGRVVPEVLLNGDHDAIAAWRQRQMLDRTRTRRPDLLPPSDP